MRPISRLTRWGLLLAACWGLLGQAALAEEEYRLRAGDTLSITVLNHPELSSQGQMIRPDGQIVLPLIQSLPGQGKTVAEFTRTLTKAYLPFVTQPQVSVTIAHFRPLQVSLLGQVNRPGKFDLEEAPTLISALAMAGGLSERAARNSIRVVSPGGASITYDLDALLSGKVPMPTLKEGEVVEVGEVWWPDLYRIIVPASAVLAAWAAFLR